MVYVIFNLLSEYGMSNVSVFNGDFLFFDYIILSNGTSKKHIKHASFKLSKYFKNNLNKVISISGLDSDWVIVDTGSILIHLMLFQSRSYYDLDCLYGEVSKKIVLF